MLKRLLYCINITHRNQHNTYILLVHQYVVIMVINYHITVSNMSSGTGNASCLVGDIHSVVIHDLSYNDTSSIDDFIISVTCMT